MTASITERKELPPVECQPWCTVKDGHPGECFLEDQARETEYLTVGLSLDQYTIDAGTSSERKPDRVAIYATKSPASPLRFWVEYVDEPPMIFTPDETQQLIENLQLLLGQVGGAR